MSVDPPQQLVGRSRLADDVDPGVGEQPREPVAEERLVVGDHDPHGSSARISCAPSGRVTVEAAVERADAVLELDEVELPSSAARLDLDARGVRRARSRARRAAVRGRVAASATTM